MSRNDSKPILALVTSVRPTIFKILFAIALTVLLTTFLMVSNAIIHTNLLDDGYRKIVSKISKTSNQTTESTTFATHANVVLKPPGPSLMSGNPRISSSNHPVSDGEIVKYCKTITSITLKEQWLQHPEVTLTKEPTGKLAYCHVPKVASTSWMLTFAEMNLIEHDELIRLFKQKAVHDLLLSSRYSLIARSYDDIKVLNKLNMYKFIFIRHPFERLVSAYHDKFNITKQQNIMRPMIRYQQELEAKKTGGFIQKAQNITFSNFVDFVLHEAKSMAAIDGSSIHWWPFTQLCKLCQIKYDFVGRAETLKDDVQKITDKFSQYTTLQNMKQRIKEKINGGHTKHSSKLTLRYFSELTKTTINKLYIRYYGDFKLGGYEFPQIYIDQAKQ